MTLEEAKNQARRHHKIIGGIFGVRYYCPRTDITSGYHVEYLGAEEISTAAEIVIRNFAYFGSPFVWCIRSGGTITREDQ